MTESGDQAAALSTDSSTSEDELLLDSAASLAPFAAADTEASVVEEILTNTALGEAIDISNLLPSVLETPGPMLAHVSVEVGGVLADALFGDMIDISDLLPSVLEQMGPVPVSEGHERDQANMADNVVDLPSDFFAPSTDLAPLFDDENGHMPL